jgi:hypothetical protein
MPFPVTLWSLINSKIKCTADDIPQFITQIQMYVITVNFLFIAVDHQLSVKFQFSTSQFH